ncbi:hypothetical protein EDC04DRAFT_2590464, partial [Pisolithus marmoratus]
AQAVKPKGHAYASGCIDCDSEYLVVQGGIPGQAALHDPQQVLEAPGSSMLQAVKATIHFLHMTKAFLPMNEVYERVHLLF